MIGSSEGNGLVKVGKLRELCMM